MGMPNLIASGVCIDEVQRKLQEKIEGKGKVTTNYSNNTLTFHIEYYAPAKLEINICYFIMSYDLEKGNSLYQDPDFLYHEALFLLQKSLLEKFGIG